MIQEAHRESARPGAVTELLMAWSDGDRNALDELVPLVYDELRRLAARYLRAERVGHTLDTGALVHEAYLRLIDQRCTSWHNRAQFFALAARSMRRVLLDHARRKASGRRRGWPVVFSDAMAPVGGRAEELLAVDQALRRLAAFDARQSRIVELRFFGGLTIEETAAALTISPATVKREWNVAKAWLRRELAGGAPLAT